jgi:hypothetical protein
MRFQAAQGCAPGIQGGIAMMGPPLISGRRRPFIPAPLLSLSGFEDDGLTRLGLTDTLLTHAKISLNAQKPVGEFRLAFGIFL